MKKGSLFLFFIQVLSLLTKNQNRTRIPGREGGLAKLRMRYESEGNEGEGEGSALLYNFYSHKE